MFIPAFNESNDVRMCDAPSVVQYGWYTGMVCDFGLFVARFGWKYDWNNIAYWYNMSLLVVYQSTHLLWEL